MSNDPKLIKDGDRLVLPRLGKGNVVAGSPIPNSLFNMSSLNVPSLKKCLMNKNPTDDKCAFLVTRENALELGERDVPIWFEAALMGFTNTVTRVLEAGVDKNMRVTYEGQDRNVIGYIQYFLVMPSNPDPAIIPRDLDMIRFLLDKGVTPPTDLYSSIEKSALLKLNDATYKGLIPNYMSLLQSLKPIEGGRRKSRKNRKNHKNRKNQSKRSRRN